MAIAFRAAGTAAAGTGDVTPGLPAGQSEDDIFLLHVESKGGEAVAAVSGWTEKLNVECGTGSNVDTRNTLFWRRATASESAPTVTDTGNHTLAVITAWTGVVTSGDPFDVAASDSDHASNSTVTADSITTTVADAMVIAINTDGAGTTITDWTNANLVSFVEAFDELTFSGGNGSVAAAYGIKTVAEATGAATATRSADGHHSNIHVALTPAAAGGSAALTGTAIAGGVLESEIVTGGDTIIITLTGDTWVAAGATFDAQRQNIIDGLDSAQSEAAGWNAEVRDKEVVAAVVRTSDTVVTVTLTAAAAYVITADETITVTIPATALVISVSAIVATPTFDVTNEGVAAGQLLSIGSNLTGGHTPLRGGHLT